MGTASGSDAFENFPLPAKTYAKPLWLVSTGSVPYGSPNPLRRKRQICEYDARRLVLHDGRIHVYE